jgi:hypothetical protein
LLEYVKENFEIAKKYTCVDDIIADNLTTHLELT